MCYVWHQRVWLPRKHITSKRRSLGSFGNMCIGQISVFKEVVSEPKWFVCESSWKRSCLTLQPWVCWDAWTEWPSGLKGCQLDFSWWWSPAEECSSDFQGWPFHHSGLQNKTNRFESQKIFLFLSIVHSSDKWRLTSSIMVHNFPKSRSDPKQIVRNFWNTF